MTLPDLHAWRRPRPRLRRAAPARRPPGRRRRAGAPHALAITHGTTVVAIRYADGVVMAGDRRATAGNLISHRTMEKVFPADRYSRRRHRRRRRAGHRDGEAVPAPARALREGRGHAPSASRARPTSSARWCAATCPRPCRASPSCRSSPATTCAAATGRLFKYDVTGGRYEEQRLRRHRLGQPPRRHRRSSSAAATDIDRDDGDRPRRPGPVRGGRRGLRHRRPRRRCGASTRRWPPSPPTASSAVRRRGRRALRSRSSTPQDRSGGRHRHEHALLRRARAGDEGPGRLRPQGHRPGPQPRRPSSTPTAS